MKRRIHLLQALLLLCAAWSTNNVYADNNKFIAPDGNTYTWVVNPDGTTATITAGSTITHNALVIPSQVTADNSTYYTVTQIGGTAFNRKAITSVTFPSTLTTIKDHAFSECTSLTSLTIPSNVTYIGVAAFRGCTGLTTITIDASPSLQIDYAAFCTDDINSLNSSLIAKGALKDVFFTTNTPPALTKGDLSFVEGEAPYFPSTAKLFVPDATDGTATTSTQYIYKQALSTFSSQIYKYFDKKLAGPFNDGTLDQYYGTLALPYAVEIPADNDQGFFVVSTVSSIKKNEGISVATLHNVSQYIPANTGVVLQNPTKAYTPRFLETTATVAPISGNKLQPCLKDGGLTNDFVSYLTLGRDKQLLAQGQTVVGFYLYTGSTIARNTAYMLYSDANAKSVTISSGDDATAINGITTTDGTSQQKVIYDLQGRRVTTPQKGIYIVNGKKILY
jgi:hypothetical protein